LPPTNWPATTPEEIIAVINSDGGYDGVGLGGRTKPRLPSKLRQQTGSEVRPGRAETVQQSAAEVFSTITILHIIESP
jgi:hypothetical protein